MSETTSSAYGRSWAPVYDALHPPLADDDPFVDVIVSLTEGSRVLELGIGTGRLALPLAEAGLVVHGIDASSEMLAALAAKNPPANLTYAEGELESFDVPHEFDLCLLAFNTICSLTTDAALAGCCRSAAAALRSRGRFVVEAFVPDLETNRTSWNEERERNGIVIRSTHERDPDTQIVDSVYTISRGDREIALPVRIRAVHPEELDGWANRAGMHLVHEWSNWDRSEFHPDAPRRIVVYERD